jgi:hypothetical protein
MRTILKNDDCIILLLINMIEQVHNTDKVDICEQGVRIQEFEFV